MRKINELIWHCTATHEGREISVSDIDRWHKARRWNGIGYHKVVHLDGSVSQGRPLHKIGAHVKGHNRGTIGYVYVGGLDKNGRPKDTRTEAQKATMVRLSQEATQTFGINKISGHRQYAAKACPCFDADKEYALITKGRDFKDPDKLLRSRTIRGSSAAALAGTGVTIDATINGLGEMQNGLEQISIGSAISIAIGLVVISGALLALYARWDDAGRPDLREIFS